MQPAVSDRRYLRLAAILLIWLASVPAFSRDTMNITVLETMSVPVIQHFTREYTEQIEQLESATGTGYTLTILNANGDADQALTLLQEHCLEGQTDLIVSVATLASQAAYRYIQGTDIPQLFTVVADPVGAGLVEEIGRPTYGQHTGIVAALPRIIQIDIALQLARQVAGNRPIHVGIIASDYPSSTGDIRMLKAAAADQPIFFHAYTFPYRAMPEGLTTLLADAKQGILALEETIDFWWEVSGPLGEVPEFSELLMGLSDKPVLYGNIRESVENGALFCMVQSIAATAAQAVETTRDILAGKDPGLIPVAPPDTFDLMINLTTALQLGVVIPPELMELAGENIYR